MTLVLFVVSVVQCQLIASETHFTSFVSISCPDDKKGILARLYSLPSLDLAQNFTICRRNDVEYKASTQTLLYTRLTYTQDSRPETQLLFMNGTASIIYYSIDASMDLVVSPTRILLDANEMDMGIKGIIIGGHRFGNHLAAISVFENRTSFSYISTTNVSSPVHTRPLSFNSGVSSILLNCGNAASIILQTLDSLIITEYDSNLQVLQCQNIYPLRAFKSEFVCIKEYPSVIVEGAIITYRNCNESSTLADTAAPYYGLTSTALITLQNNLPILTPLPLNSEQTIYIMPDPNAELPSSVAAPPSIVSAKSSESLTPIQKAIISVSVIIAVLGLTIFFIVRKKNSLKRSLSLSSNYMSNPSKDGDLKRIDTVHYSLIPDFKRPTSFISLRDDSTRKSATSANLMNDKNDADSRKGDDILGPLVKILSRVDTRFGKEGGGDGTPESKYRNYIG